MALEDLNEVFVEEKEDAVISAEMSRLYGALIVLQDRVVKISEQNQILLETIKKTDQCVNSNINNARNDIQNRLQVQKSDIEAIPVQVSKLVGADMGELDKTRTEINGHIKMQKTMIDNASEELSKSKENMEKLFEGLCRHGDKCQSALYYNWLIMNVAFVGIISILAYFELLSLKSVTVIYLAATIGAAMMYVASLDRK